MSVMLVTLCLNETEWLPRLVEQHRSWPELSTWVFVEAADQAYAKANPSMVTPDGFSVDGTTEFLSKLCSTRDPRFRYIAHGFSQNPDYAKGKCEARQRYFDVAEQIRPEFVIMVDADEFYTREDQGRVLEWMRRYPTYDSFVFRKREVWRPPSISASSTLFYEVVGGFWNIPCCHWWRWRQGMNHRDCHNTPSLKDGMPVNRNMMWLDKEPSAPQMIHCGFAASEKSRKAKNKYYADRGEAVDGARSWYVESRKAWETWKPGDRLPRGAEVILYDGPRPEVLE